MERFANAGKRDKQRVKEKRHREATIVDETMSSESSHVRVLPLIEASRFLLKINVTILS